MKKENRVYSCDIKVIKGNIDKDAHLGCVLATSEKDLIEGLKGLYAMREEEIEVTNIVWIC